jgi:L-lactate dehydrogenase complex protein LldF
MSATGLVSKSRSLPIVNHIEHPELADEFVGDEDRAHWHDAALWFIRQKRDRQAKSLPEWETLRSTAAQIKQYTIANLPKLLLEFEARATELGAVVHWASDAAEHNQIVLEILQANQIKQVVKSKSMLTEECHLNPYLEQNGIDVVDTDLGEWIVQLRKEPPSHIVLPAIHIKKEEVGDTFHQHINTPKGNADPDFLAKAARRELRSEFMAGQAGISGVNFAIAETGGIVICTNEGNADLGVSLPNVHIACMGIEKLIPRFQDLSVFIRLLGRSATGQPITAYTSHFHGPRAGGQLHIVLVDNGRSQIRADEHFRRSLSCIRCGACMNTCPVYRRSGGHSYASAVPGPIGSILSPLSEPKKHRSLPFACSLCGSCTDVCPVKIDLHHQLLLLRGKLGYDNILPLTKRIAMSLASQVLRRPWLYRMAGRFARLGLRIAPRWAVYNRFNAWGKSRELPPASSETFRSKFANRAKSNSNQSADQ